MTRSDDVLADIWMRSRGVILERVHVLERCAAALVASRLDYALRAEGEREAHRLAGSLGTFGVTGASEIARTLETRLADPTPFRADEVAPFCDRALQLARLVEAHDRRIQGLPAIPRTSKETPPRPTIWLVGHESSFAPRLENLVAPHGWELASFRDARAALPHITEAPTHVVVVWSSQDPETNALVQRLRTAHTAPRILALGDEDDLDARVDAAQAGVDRFLSRTLEPDEVVSALSPHQEGHAGSVLVIDDDRAVLDVIGQALRVAGHNVHTLDDPDQAWNMLDQAAPDLILLDLDMPHHDGIDLCRAIRTDPRWDDVPILFLTATTDPALHQNALEAGGEDVITKPVEPERLAARIGRRLSQTTRTRSAGETDPDTGLLNPESGHADVRRLIALAAREGRPLALAISRLHRPPVADPEEAQRRLARGLRRQMRPEDVIHVEGRDVVVAAYGIDREGLAERVQGALLRLAARGKPPFAVAGVAGHGIDGNDLATLGAAARAALENALIEPQHGVVRLAGDVAVRVERPDIVVVDDDETVAALLRHTLEANGYGVRWIPDGKVAEEMLAGASPRLRPRLILLDVNLPGLDGLSLLRRLRDDGVLKHTKVVMLTVRSIESEVLKAFDIGAADHVAKPFSVPVLLQRIHNALGG